MKRAQRKEGIILHHICKNCEHRILDGCDGLDDDMPDMYTGACFLDNVYGLSTSTDDLELMQSTYQKSVNELTDVEWHEKFIAEAIGMDIMLSGKESILYPFWVLRRSIAITHQLEMYQKLGVTLTLQDYCPESFYAGIPKPTASDIKRAKEYLNERSDN